MKRAHWLIIGTALFLIGCATQSETTTVLQHGFSKDEVAWSLKDGKNRITGEAILKSKGQTYHCGPYTAIATPDSPYARERMQALYGSLEQGHRSTEQPPITLRPHFPVYSQTQRTADCDDTGHFVFDGLPDGTWYVVVPVIWQNKLGEPFNGGSFMKRVSVAGAATVTVIMDTKGV